MVITVMHCIQVCFQLVHPLGTTFNGNYNPGGFFSELGSLPMVHTIEGQCSGEYKGTLGDMMVVSAHLLYLAG